MVRIKARFEDGVLHPLASIDLPEGATVEISIISEGWSERLRSVLERARQRTRSMSPEEIEAEITRAAAEVRSARIATPR